MYKAINDIKYLCKLDKSEHLFLEEMMNSQIEIQLDEKKKTAYSKMDVVKLDTKCLYAGKLERIKQWREKPHEHPFCEILFVLAGSGETVVDGKHYNIKKGDIIVYNPHTVHEESTSGDVGLELGFFGITNFQISGLPLDHLIDNESSPVLHTKKDFDKYSFYFKSLAEEVYEGKQYSELMAKYWARLILIGILRLANISEAKFVSNAIFTKIHQYLSKNFATIETMEQICDDLNISKYYLSHVFKKYMGTPPMQFVTVKRISYAKKLLQETDLTATEVGEKCGYKDHVLFFKAFKKSEGITPMQYRKQTQGYANLTRV